MQLKAVFCLILAGAATTLASCSSSSSGPGSGGAPGLTGVAGASSSKAGTSGAIGGNTQGRGGIGGADGSGNADRTDTGEAGAGGPSAAGGTTAGASGIASPSASGSGGVPITGSAGTRGIAGTGGSTGGGGGASFEGGGGSTLPGSGGAGMIGSGGHGGGQGSDGQGGYAISATGGSSGGPAGTGGTTVPDLDAPITGTRQTWNRYSFIVPAEMDGTEDAPNYLMTAKNSASQGLCALLFMPPRTAETDQATQALTLMSLFADSLELSVSTQNDPRSFYRRGVSAGGWDYVFLTGDLVEKGTGYTTDVQTEITLVNLGAEVAPIVGIQLRNNPCLHNSLFNDHYMPWATLYHSLEFQGFVPATSDRLAKKLLGGWQHKDGSFFTSYVFAANGRYSTFSAFDQYTSISLTEILVTTTAYSGDGAFQVKGNGVFLFPDGKPARAALFRIEESGPLSSSGAWLAQYYELRSAGGLYEFAYTQ